MVGDEPWGYTKGWIFLDHLRVYRLHKKDFVPWSFVVRRQN
jgi:hypothetical protein